jgi:hypothetical protein
MSTSDEHLESARLLSPEDYKAWAKKQNRLIAEYGSPEVYEPLRTKAERYDMIINHLLRNSEAGHRIIIIKSDDIKSSTHSWLEVYCDECGWWDHWDEPRPS